MGRNDAGGQPTQTVAAVHTVHHTIYTVVLGVTCIYGVVNSVYVALACVICICMNMYHMYE